MRWGYTGVVRSSRHGTQAERETGGGSLRIGINQQTGSYKCGISEVMTSSYWLNHTLSDFNAR